MLSCENHYLESLAGGPLSSARDQGQRFYPLQRRRRGHFFVYITPVTQPRPWSRSPRASAIALSSLFPSQSHPAEPAACSAACEAPLPEHPKPAPNVVAPARRPFRRRNQTNGKQHRKSRHVGGSRPRRQGRRAPGQARLQAGVSPQAWCIRELGRLLLYYCFCQRFACYVWVRWTEIGVSLRCTV